MPTVHVNNRAWASAWGSSWAAGAWQAETAPSIALAGSDITLTVTANWSLAVDAAAIQPAGSVIALSVTSTEQVSGGWAHFVRHEQDALRRKRRREEEELRAELEAEADRLEAHLIETGVIEPVSADIVRIRRMVAEYRDGLTDLPKRLQKAIAYADEAQTNLAYVLAERAIQRAEEEEFALLMALAID